ncbi:MAG: manganese efflux pump [Clostridiales bacterium]|nr:manganese efflux pump [Clostridiales bacterium]
MALLNGFLLAIGLAFESFVVAMANGLHNANFGLKRALRIALLFAVCHAVALLLGYMLIKTVAQGIQRIDGWLTWIAATVLVLLGIKMIVEGVQCARGKCEKPARTGHEFVVQSIVASFDAFASGLTMPSYSVWFVLLTAAIICAVIMPFYIVGFWVGKKCGTKFGKYSALLGGLVFIGLAAEVIIGALK